MASAAVVAFDREAAGYDTGFGRDPVGLVFRHTVQERLLALFPPGARVLDLGCGTGEDALLLASRGIQVEGLDPAPGMIEQAREKARQRGLAERARFRRLAAESVAEVGAGFSGAYSNFGALNCADLSQVGDGLARVLDAGAPVLLCLLGPSPLPALVERALAGRGERRGDRPPNVSGVPVPATYPAPRAVMDAMGPSYAWTGTFGLGVLLPAPGRAGWARRSPQAFALLAACERVVRRWPLLRSLGDHVVLEGRRR